MSEPDRPRAGLDLLEAIYTTRSIRRFSPEPLPDELVERVLDAAIRAPSGTNSQTWRFLVVRDPALRAQLGELYRQCFREVYPADRVQSEADPTRRRVIRSADYLADQMGSEPPVLVLVCLERPAGSPPGRAAGSSAYPAVQNLLLAARGLGLGGCLTTLHLRREAQVKELLGIPEAVDTYALIPLGRPASPHGPLNRRPVREVTFLNRWGARTEVGGRPG